MSELEKFQLLLNLAGEALYNNGYQTLQGELVVAWGDYLKTLPPLKDKE